MVRPNGAPPSLCLPSRGGAPFLPASKFIAFRPDVGRRSSSRTRLKPHERNSRTHPTRPLKLRINPRKMLDPPTRRRKTTRIHRARPRHRRRRSRLPCRRRSRTRRRRSLTRSRRQRRGRGSPRLKRAQRQRYRRRTIRQTPESKPSSSTGATQTTIRNDACDSSPVRSEKSDESENDSSPKSEDHSPISTGKRPRLFQSACDRRPRRPKMPSRPQPAKIRRRRRRRRPRTNPERGDPTSRQPTPRLHRRMVREGSHRMDERKQSRSEGRNPSSQSPTRRRRRRRRDRILAVAFRVRRDEETDADSAPDATRDSKPAATSSTTSPTFADFRPCRATTPFSPEAQDKPTETSPHGVDE